MRTERNVSHTSDRDLVGRHYDLWQGKVLPTYRFALTVDGGDVEVAVAAIRRLVGVCGLEESPA